MPRTTTRVTITKDKEETLLEEENLSSSSLIIRDAEDNSESVSYAVTRHAPSLPYTVITLIASGMLATGAVVLFYDSNKLGAKYNAKDVLNLLGGVGINWGQSVFFTKETIDVLRDLKKGDQPFALRISKVITGLVVGVIATVPSVVAEYAESKQIFNTLLQICGLPVNVVGVFGPFDIGVNIGQSLLRKKQPFYNIGVRDQAFMKQAQQTLLINLHRLWPKIKKGECLIPHEGSLVSKLFSAVTALPHGEDLTFKNKCVYYFSKITRGVLSVITPTMLMVGAAGYLASSRHFFYEGPISWLHAGSIGSWFVAISVMFPQYGLSILAGLSLANMASELILSTSFAEGWKNKVKSLLPNMALLDNNLMRGLLGLGLASVCLLGFFSGETSKILYEKYFPDFAGKYYLSNFMRDTTIGFNMYYYFAFAILQGAAGYYRNYGTEEQRAITASIDNFRELLAEIKDLAADEMPHLLIEINKLEERHAEISYNSPVQINEHTPLINADVVPKDYSASDGKSSIKKAIGPKLVDMLDSLFWIKKPVSETQRQSFYRTDPEQLQVLTRAGKAVPEHVDSHDNEELPKRGLCPGMTSCTIL